MIESGDSVERIREALAHLYDPTVLAELPLATQLADSGAPRSRSGLYDTLLTSIERLKPPGVPPHQSHGWRCYRYLVLRYVDCAGHDAIARELEISSRQAYRVHADALQALAAVVIGHATRGPTPAGPAESAGARAGAATCAEPDLSAVGRQPPEGGVDLVEVARGIQATIERIIIRQGGQLRIEIPEHLAAVRVNRVCLRQIVLNLALHLVQSTPGGALVLGAEATPSAVRLTIRSDTDCAERPDLLPSDSDDEAALAAAQHLARLQGLTLTEAGTPPRAFSLDLPVGMARTVLLVDDNPDIGDLFRRMLAKTPYRLLHCRTGDRALQMARENRPDVIVLDVVMPTRDGWELLALFQRGPATARVPVVVCSVLPDRALALSLDAAAFIPKPVARPALLATLDAVTARAGGDDRR